MRAINSHPPCRRRRRTREYLCRTVVCLLTLFAAGVASGEASVVPVSHPNHYLFLIDASGSARSRPSYRQAVNFAVEHAYSDGYGVIPPIDPSKDVVTIEHFGCIDHGPVETAYMRLDTVDFFKDLIHPVIVRAPNVAADRVRGIAFSTRSYHLTLLVWAPRLGVAVLVPPHPEAVSANRTFRILVTDWVDNDSTMKEELRDIDNFGRKESVAAAKDALEKFDKAYSIGDAHGGDGALFRQKFSLRADDPNVVAVEVCEVRSKDIDGWAAKAASLDRRASESFDWNGTEGDTVRGRMLLTLSPGLRSLVFEPSARSWIESSGATYPVTGTAPVQIPVSVKGCAPVPVQILFHAEPVMVDPILGTVHYTFAAPGMIAVPLPPACGTPRLVLMLFLIALALAMLAWAVYYLTYTRYRTHFVARKVAGHVSWPLRWDRHTYIDDVITPGEKEPLLLALPVGWRRTFLYRNAELLVRSDPPDQFQWNGSSRATIALAEAGGEASVRRKPGAQAAARLWVEVRKRQRAAVFQTAPPAEERHA